MSDYDFGRFETILEKVIRNRCEVSDCPEDLEIGENISDLQEIKVIFDGFGLVEDFYHNGRTFKLEDDTVMVQNDDYGYDPLSEDDEDYEYVREKLDTFEEFANADGPCNPDSQSFAVFIHKNSGDPEFEFPEHDRTPWGIIHRPAEEVCLYVWWDRENDIFDVIPLEDRLSDDDGMTIDEVMGILETIMETHCMDDDDDTEPFPFPPARPVEGKVAWPFATAPLNKVSGPVETEREDND